MLYQEMLITSVRDRLLDIIPHECYFVISNTNLFVYRDFMHGWSSLEIDISIFHDLIKITTYVNCVSYNVSLTNPDMYQAIHSIVIEALENKG